MMVEGGLVQHWHVVTVANLRREKGLLPSSDRVSRSTLALQPLFLKDTLGIIFLMALGVALSFITLALECLCHKQ